MLFDKPSALPKCVYTLSCSVVSNPLRPHAPYSPPGFSVHGIFQARILEGVAISYPRGSSRPRDQTCVALAGRFFTASPPGKPSCNLEPSPKRVSSCDLCFLRNLHCSVPFVSCSQGRKERLHANGGPSVSLPPSNPADRLARPQPGAGVDDTHRSLWSSRWESGAGWESGQVR